jgi:DNA-binding GntR family transcriptional regulator
VQLADDLTPISVNFSLKDHTYAVLREAILKMNIYHPDVDLRLDERKLAVQLAVSRTPIREALSRLASEGLVEIVPRKGVYVQRRSRDEILDMVIAWAALETMAARMATENASDTDLRRLRNFALKHSDSARHATLEEYSDANITFHQTILELSGCPLLKSMADGLFTHMLAIRRRAMGEGDRASRSVADHTEIIEALEARDADLAARLVREHTLRLHDHIKRTWSRFESIHQQRTDTA